MRTAPTRVYGVFLASLFVVPPLGACRQQGDTTAPDAYPCEGRVIKILAMNEAMEGEDRGEVFDTNVRYLDEVAREEYLLRIEGGKVTSSEGGGYDTHGEFAIFVLSPDGALYATTEDETGIFHHSSFLAGGPVAGAGELIVAGGSITTFTDRSGHYRPGTAHTGQTLCWLAEQGVDLSAVTFRSIHGDTSPASAVVRTASP